MSEPATPNTCTLTSGSLSSNVCTVPLNGLQQQHPISKLRPSNGSGRLPLPLGEITVFAATFFVAMAEAALFW